MRIAMNGNRLPLPSSDNFSRLCVASALANCYILLTDPMFRHRYLGPLRLNSTASPEVVGQSSKSVAAEP